MHESQQFRVIGFPVKIAIDHSLDGRGLVVFTISTCNPDGQPDFNKVFTVDAVVVDRQTHTDTDEGTGLPCVLECVLAESVLAQHPELVPFASFVIQLRAEDGYTAPLVGFDSRHADDPDASTSFYGDGPLS